MRSLNSTEYAEVWDTFESAFKFHPSVNGPFPAISEPACSVTFRLNADYTEEQLDELGAAIRLAFAESGSPSDEIYYLDWQHDSFIGTISSMPAWMNGYPDGDYASLLRKDLQSGTFGHPWEGSICFFGDAFVNEILRLRPAMLDKPIRNRGSYKS
jgi:hypothetical protein